MVVYCLTGFLLQHRHSYWDRLPTKLPRQVVLAARVVIGRAEVAVAVLLVAAAVGVPAWASVSELRR